MPNNRQEPLSSLTLNQQNERIIHHSYKPLGPRIDHIARPLLPWENSEVTGLRIFELFWDPEVVNVLVESTNAYAKEKGARGAVRRGRLPQMAGQGTLLGDFLSIRNGKR